MNPFARKWPRSVLPALILIVLLTPVGASHGAAARTNALVGPVGTLPSGLTFDFTHAPAGSSLLGALPSTQPLTFEVGLALSDRSGLQQLLAEQEDPSSVHYHQFLTSAQFSERYAPTPAEAAQVQGYFVGHGAQNVQLTGDRMSMNFVLPARDVPAAFGTTLATYRSSSGDQVFYAPTHAPSLPPSIAADLVRVDGLSNVHTTGVQTFYHSLGSFSLPGGSSGMAQFRSPASYDTTTDGSQLFWGTDYPAVYDAQSLINAGVTGSGWSVATILWSGFNGTTSTNLPPWDPGAVNQYLSTTFPLATAIPTITGEAVTFGGNTAPPPGAYTQGDDTGGIEETSLDLEMVASTAPGAHVYCFYLPGDFLTGNQATFSSAFDQALSSALAFSYGGNGLAAISNSYGLSDQNDSLWNNLEAQAAAQGVTLLVSSGDAGDAPSANSGRPQGEWPTWPATATFQTYGAVAVGGTSVVANGVPYSTGYNPSSGLLPPMGYDANQITGVQSQSIWYESLPGAGNTAGSEGGISSVYNEPKWQAQSAAQSGIEYAARQQQVNYARAVPDISSIGNQTVIFTDSTGGIQGALVAGTSIACPVFAGFVVLIDQQDGKQGFLDPQLYSIGGYFETQAPTSALDPFEGQYDVTTGHNWVFNASVGWDAGTGWGTPDVARLAQDLVNPTYTGYVYNPNAVPGQPGSLPSPTPSGVPTLYIVAAGLLVILVVIVVAVVLVRHKRAPATAAGTAAPPSMAVQAPSPYAVGPPHPAPYGYGGGGYGYAAAPPPSYPPQTYAYGTPYGGGYGAAPPPQGYPTHAYATPANTAPQPPPMVGPVYYCRYCRNPRPYTNSACPSCGGPL